MSESQNNIAWEKIFDIYNILECIASEGKFVIKSDIINEFRQARLMTKFDHKFQLPNLFVNNNLSILPISRGEYMIAPINTFCEFNNNINVDIKDISIPPYLESLDYVNITSEAMAINCAYVSGVISDFTDDTDLFPTVNGRMSSSSFKFKVESSVVENTYLDINVNNSQVEIDGGYEGLNFLNLIEAKNVISSDFLIRQLYYPFRLWESKVNKKVKPLFLVYSNGIFHLREYCFEDINCYNSIKLVKEKKYRLQDPSSSIINMQTIQELIVHSSIVEEPEVPFPQADSFERIINLCEIIDRTKDKTISKEKLSSNYDFTEKASFELRQVDYYTNAAIYLGFVSKNRGVNNFIYYSLTNRGRALFKFHISERQIKFIEAILEHAVFNKALNLYLREANKPSRANIVTIMKEAHLYKVGSMSTFERRASTVMSWLDWIISLIEE